MTKSSAPLRLCGHCDSRRETRLRVSGAFESQVRAEALRRGDREGRHHDKKLRAFAPLRALPFTAGDAAAGFGCF